MISISIINALETPTKTLDDFLYDKKVRNLFPQNKSPSIIYSYDIIAIIFPVTCKHITSHHLINIIIINAIKKN